MLLLVLAAALFLGVASRTVTAPFGDSHDGRNAGVWASGSHSLRQDGVTASRLGTRSPENGVYANHPPLIYLETALAETLGRGSALATRAPAWLGSLAVIALLAVLLKDRGLRSGPVAVGVALVVTTPMFLVYGTMLDTPVTSLPFGLALLLLWGRARDGRPVRPPVAFTFAALAVLAGWQSLAVAAVLAMWAVVRLVRRRDGRVADAAFAAGALAGVALLLAWLFWAFDGSLAHLWDQILFRTGQGDQSVPLIELLRSQRRDVQAMLGVVGVLAFGGLGVALMGRRTRSLAVVALCVTVPYPLLFPAGAANHDYWNFWLVLPLAVGLAAGGHWLVSTVIRVRRPDAVLAVAGTLLAVVATVGVVVRPPAAAWTIREGIRGGRVAEAARLAPGQRTAWYAGAVGAPATWWALAAHRPAVKVPVDGLAALAADRPADVVLFGILRCTDGAPRITYGVAPAAELANRPPEVTRCQA
ncbi:MAG TPA: hypothetical protein VNA57_12635 [Acidimicrobiales bacterium]|nr:hypothetical protein [Acidimicrobiales bacterium]